MEKARCNTELYSNLSEPLNNVKPSNFWGSCQFGLLFSFFALLVGFSFPGPLSGGFAPPAAQANLRSVFHDFKACATLRILHFYLELRF